jgi:hypothetical protein
MARERTAIIGAGGIGSHFLRLLDKMIRNKQLGDGVTHHDFAVFDYDVVEPKNCRHQDYELTEVGLPKAAVMTLRYEFPHFVKKFGEEEVAQWASYIICADNAAVRSIIFKHAKATDKRFLDMRAEGDMYAVYTDRAELASLLGSLGEDPESDAGFSCQRPGDTARGVIQLGNFFAAPAGMDIWLRMCRKTIYPAERVQSII